MRLERTAPVQFLLQSLSLFRHNALFGVVPLLILEVDCLQSCSLTPKPNFLVLILIDLIQALSNPIDYVLLQVAVLFVLLEAVEEDFKDGGEFIRQLRLRKVEVDVAEGVELSNVEGRIGLYSLAERLEQQQLETGRVSSEEKLHRLADDWPYGLEIS
jgi:hypothetical protein